MINLLPWREMLYQRFRKIFGLSIIIVLVVSFVLALILRQYECFRLNREMESYASLIANNKRAGIWFKSQLKELKKSEFPVLNKIRLSSQHRILLFLKNVACFLPPNSYMVSVLYNKHQWILDGILLNQNQEPLKKFISNLKSKYKNTRITMKLGLIECQKIEYRIFFDFPKDNQEELGNLYG